MKLSNRKWFLLTAAASFTLVIQGCQAASTPLPAPATRVSSPASPVVQTVAPVPVATATIISAPTDNPLKLVTKVQDEVMSQPQAVLNRRIPRLTGASSDPVELFNLLAEESVEKEALTFKEGLKGWTPYPDMPPVPSSFLSGYTVYTANERLISLRLEFSTYVTGAAHPYSYVRTLNYDLRGGEPVSLKQVFKPDADYLAYLSDYCRKDLLGRGIDPLFEEGLAPTPENFRSWVLTREGLWIDFDPYQVAAYAVGPQHILVPFDRLTGMLAEDGPAAWLDAPALHVDAMQVPPLWPTPVPTP